MNTSKIIMKHFEKYNKDPLDNLIIESPDDIFNWKFIFMTVNQFNFKIFHPNLVDYYSKFYFMIEYFFINFYREIYLRKYYFNM